MPGGTGECAAGAGECPAGTGEGEEEHHCREQRIFRAVHFVQKVDNR